MNVNSGDGFDLDQLLEQELQRTAGHLEGPTSSAGQSAYHAFFTSGGTTVSAFSFSSIAAAVSTKAVIAVTAATLVGGAAVGTVATGSPNPANWGKAVVTAVQGCKTEEGTASDSAKTASTARDNVGQCVSAVAKQKGEAERALHAKASAARLDHPTGKPAGVTGGKPDTTPAGKPNDVPSGKPAGVPAGPPATVPPASGDTHPTGAPVSPPAHR
ncbi:MAG: hypothetical protein NVS9B1_03260 [Candidatus Dormibacteraceae bacterium]